MRGGLIFFGVLMLLAIAAIVALCLRPAFVIGVSEKSLAYSIRGAADADETGRCQGDDEHFACTVVDGERQIAYAVTVDDWGCWEAKVREADPGLPQSLDGCITIADLVRLND